MGVRTSPTRGRWRRSKSRRRSQLYLLLAIVDAGVLLLAHAAAGALRFGDAFDAEAMKLAAARLPLFVAAALATE